MAEDPIAWARDRRVALRPDGARRSFNPWATCLLRTDAERQRFAAGLKVLHAQALARINTATNLFGGDR